MTEPLTCQADLFSLNGVDCWLNSAYMGPLPKPVQQAGVEALARRAFPVDITPDDFFAPADRVRRLCAQLVNADPEAVALVPTVAYGMAIVARNLRPRRGQNVVLLGEQFPSNVYPWRDWREGWASSCARVAGARCALVGIAGRTQPRRAMERGDRRRDRCRHGTRRRRAGALDRRHAV